eukprot:6550525-Prymnesium_polylepis.1
MEAIINPFGTADDDALASFDLESAVASASSQTPSAPTAAPAAASAAPPATAAANAATAAIATEDAATVTADAEDGVELVGERTLAERDALGRKRAIVLDEEDEVEVKAVKQIKS